MAPACHTPCLSSPGAQRDAVPVTASVSCREITRAIGFVQDDQPRGIGDGWRGAETPWARVRRTDAMSDRSALTSCATIRPVGPVPVRAGRVGGVLAAGAVRSRGRPVAAVGRAPWGELGRAPPTHRTGLCPHRQGGLAVNQIAGQADDFAAFLARRGATRPDDDDLHTYPALHDATAQMAAWPPDRTGPCWCGSRRKYKQCCRPHGLGMLH